jgi:hypothetical protein
VTFRLFDENWRGQVLGLSPLNGDLFGAGTLQDLDECALDNHDLLRGIRQLSLYEQKRQLGRVNYGALDVEELGSVYESLLDFHPQVVQRQGIYAFQLVTGSERKTTGSYYTPPELVGQLIKSALEPVIEEKLNALTPLGFPYKRKEDKEKLFNRGGGGEGISQERALLSIKVCDPACGSGHFLLAAARRLGTELARVRTGEAQPGPEPLRHAIRDVIQNCIYGVDLNPLAVDLCKVALWIEGFYRGLPLNFLDHRIKCGNSLVGVLDLDCLKEGIPDAAFKAVTGDDKQLSSQFRKRNKSEREKDLQGQLSVFEDFKEERSHFAQTWRELGAIGETTTAEVRQKQAQYHQSRQSPAWWRDRSACNLWTSAFFTPLTEQNLQLLPTTAALTQLLRGNLSTQRVVEAANKLAEEKHFFHWALEFPEVFKQGGFDCVLGNPPWERIKLQEKEFFAARSAEIANAANKAAREQLIKQLQKRNPDLAQAFEDAKHDAEAQSKFIREAGRFPLTAVGDINTYAVFAETMRTVISLNGRAGVIVPTGIATDDTCKMFFGDLIQKQALASLYDFENRKAIFTAVHRSYKFSLLAINSKPIKRGNFAFFLTQPRQIDNQARLFQLSPQDIALLNPNTLTCPIFRTRADAELTKKIYQRVPVLENEQTGKNPWGVSFMAMFHMANDSGLFRNEAGDGLVPLYEAKMFHQFDHRWATYTIDGNTCNLIDLEKGNPHFLSQPRYWVNRTEVENKLGAKWEKDWLLAFRDVTNATNERTAICSILPKVGVGHTAPIAFLDKNNCVFTFCLLTNWNSLVFDFVTRQKIGGTHLTFTVFRQLPVLPPEAYSTENIKFISSRVLELVYTAWDMQPFAQDMGYNGEPFRWDSQRRALLRAELDAYYAKLYGLTRDELRYILDPADVYGPDFPSETFHVLKNNEMRQFGEYRTQRLVLEVWDRMFE